MIEDNTSRARRPSQALRKYRRVKSHMTSMSITIWFAFIVMYASVVVSFKVYQEGYLNTEFFTDRPNLPFATDTNRWSDGYTSTSGSGEISSSHFQLYSGAIGNTSDRYLKFATYMADAAIQGLAGYGAGEAQQEDAKVVILNKLAEDPNLEAPKKTFTVYAAIKWNPSNFAIQEGEYYKIEVLGNASTNTEQFWYDGGIRVNADGYRSYYDAVSNCFISLGRCRSHLKKKRRLPQGNWMGLVCSIGEFVRPAEEIAPGDEKVGKYLPLDEASLAETLFFIGLGTEFRAEYTGQLICFANDAHTLYWNNRGTIDVTATRLSWPPTAEVYYQGLYLPACDSALAVYANKGDDVNGPIKCNPNGGGTGWPKAAIAGLSAQYGSGQPDFLMNDDDGGNNLNPRDAIDVQAYR